MPKVKNSKCDILSNFQIICPSRPNSTGNLFSKNSVEFIFHVEENFANCCCYFFLADIFFPRRHHHQSLPLSSSSHVKFVEKQFLFTNMPNQFLFFALEAKSRGFFGLKKKAKKNFFFLTDSWSFFVTSPRMDETLALTKSNCKLPSFPLLKRYKKILGKGLIDKWIRESFSRLCSSQNKFANHKKVSFEFSH